ncbi:DUF4271 domain-containing protein [Fibrella sp. HMF5036]|uniref:DUF4271 domain-containing protein n=1 Tax=Fibrella aquatilis TaxID=2817059 RepID=A0A939JY42_9BACT|nr:DUF4271 domain-containing protein [Fibrella aquatilis]
MITLSLVISFTLSLFAQGRQEGVGPEQLYFPVHDLQADLLVYDEAFKTYVPYITEQHASEQALSAYVDVESNRRYKLLLQSKADGFLFIEAALRRKCPAGQWLVLDLDSLFQVYKKPQLFITLYGAAGAANWQAYIGHPRSAAGQTIRLNDDLLSVRPRNFSGFISFFSAGLLFLLAVHAFLISFFRRAFQTFYNPLNLITADPADDSFLINRPLGRVSMAFTLALSLSMAFLFMYVQHLNINLFSMGTLLPHESGFGTIVFNYGIISGLIFLSLLAKYAFVAAVGSLYKFDTIVNLHYFRVIQSSLLFITILIILVAALNPGNMVEIPVSYVLLPFIVFYLARLAWLYVTLVGQLPVKNLYLFSYLCIVELIPLVVGIRFAV